MKECSEFVGAMVVESCGCGDSMRVPVKRTIWINMCVIVAGVEADGRELKILL